MDKQDITQIIDIDREAFPNDWPPTNFQYELRNQVAHYLVACEKEKTIELPEVSLGLVSRVKRFFVRDYPLLLTRAYIVGFAGFWTMCDEAHVTSIAVRQSYRRLGIGELLLVSIISSAKELNTSFITLEVRASNIVAQSLYSKCGFKQVGIRRDYYSNDREDAILMAIENVI
ncbi:ribosomal protein S18-alanine N-acetyltransferase [Chloroflexota bacterium]